VNRYQAALVEFALTDGECTLTEIDIIRVKSKSLTDANARDSEKPQ
jgi:hypothetical protein